MTFGPYRSNLLRFAVRQYRQGLSRHQVAVRTARSGAVMGAAVTLLPVYAVANASLQLGMRLRLRLESALDQPRLPDITDDVARLLNFSGLDDLVSDDAAVVVSDLVGFKPLPSLPEQVMAKMLRSVGGMLSTQQVGLLLATDSQRSAGLVLRAKEWLTRAGGKRGGEVAEAQRITGVASDLETRSLVLVQGYCQVWCGLSVEQQRHLQTEMTAWLQADTSLQGHFQYVGEDSLLPEKEASEKVAVEFWGRVGALSLRLGEVRSPSLSSGESLAVSERVEIDESFGTKDFLEAVVVATSYVEHPLEAVLNWVDRWLVWIENCWQRLRQWLLQRFVVLGNKGFGDKK